MEKFFIEILNLSISGSFIILAVILLRFIFKKAPKYLSLIFWVLVFIKLLCPIKIESNLSLVPSSNVIPQNIVYAQNPNITSGITVIDNAVNPVLESSMAPNLGGSVNPMQIFMYVAANLWVLGVALMLIYTLVSYTLLKRKVRASINAYENVYYCDYIESPFVLGIIKPKIYLPSGISEKEAQLVILHEKAHIKRLDHVSKFIGFIPLAVHWFNPLVWLSYHLFSKDIESAADESVIGNKELSFKKEYSETLLSLSNKRKVLVCPLAFGEIGVKQRVKNILSFKKPTIWIVVAAIISAVILAVCFLSSKYRENDSSSLSDIHQLETIRNTYPEYFDLNIENGLSVYVWQLSENSYNCGILEGDPENHHEDDIYSLKGAEISEIKLILSTYNINKNNIAVVPYKMPYSSYYYKITPEYKEWIEASLGVSEKTLEDIYAEKNASNPMFNIETDKDIGENFSNDLEDFGEHIGESINFDGNGKGEWIFRLHAISENMTGTLYLDDEVKLEKAHNRWWMNSWWMEYGEYMRNVKGYDYATPEYLETSSRYSLKINNGTVMSKNYKIIVPFDLNEIYGALEVGQYKVTKTLYYEKDNGDVQTKEVYAIINVVPEDNFYTINMVNPVCEGELYNNAANASKLASAERRLPILKISSYEELQEFYANYDEELDLKKETDKYSSFYEDTISIKSEFFESGYAFLIVYIPSSSSSYTYSLTDKAFNHDSIQLTITRNEDDNEVTDDEAGFLLVHKVNTNELVGIKNFDAVLVIDK